MNLPLSIVDHPSFRNFMFDVDPKYRTIHRRDLTRSFLPNLQKKCASKLAEVCNQSTFVSLTLDMWCDRRVRSYLGITMHTITDDKFSSFLLSFEQLEGQHTSVRLAAEFDRVIQMYNLNGKVVRLVTDNASNNIAAFDSIVLPGFEDYFDEADFFKSESESDSAEEDEEKDAFPIINRFQINDVDDIAFRNMVIEYLPSDEEYLRIPCFAHCLQLVVKDGINASDALSLPLKKVASLAKMAHSSTVFADHLGKSNYTIPQANRTRWNSQFQMVKKVLIIPASLLNSILTDMKKTDLILTSQDRKILEEFVSLFELFNQATIVTQGDSYSTITLVAPTVLGILFDLERELTSSSLVLTSLCETLISSIKARFSGLLRHFDIDVPYCKHSMSERFSDLIFLISPLMDARFKIMWLNNLHTVVKMRVLDKIRSAFVRFFSKLAVPLLNNKESYSSNTTEQMDFHSIKATEDVPGKRKCLFPYLHENKKVSFDDKSKILIELDAFIREDSCNETLLFSKKHLYPYLYQLALKYLSVPATSAAIERVFSRSGFLMRPHRCSLSSKNLCMLTFLKCNENLL